MLLHTILLTLLSIQLAYSAPLGKRSHVRTNDENVSSLDDQSHHRPRLVARQAMQDVQFALKVATDPTVDQALVATGKFIAKEAPVVGHAIHKEAHALHMEEHKLKNKLKTKMHHAGEKIHHAEQKVKGFFGKVFHHGQQEATTQPAKSHVAKTKQAGNESKSKNGHAAAHHDGKVANNGHAAAKHDGKAAKTKKGNQASNHSAKIANPKKETANAKSHKTTSHASANKPSKAAQKSAAKKNSGHHKRDNSSASIQASRMAMRESKMEMRKARNDMKTSLIHGGNQGDVRKAREEMRKAQRELRKDRMSLQTAQRAGRQAKVSRAGKKP